jgi:CDP-glycerol glycerophosphotransferase (TagB/SpsB family)
MENNDSIEPQSDSKRARIEVSLANMSTDPYLRKIIYDYHPNDRDNIRRAYLQQQQQKKKKKKKKKKNLVNHLTIIFHKHNLEKHRIVLIKHGSKNILIGWNTAF